MTPHRHPASNDPPTAVLAILDTFRHSPHAVSDQALETLRAFGLIEPTDAGAQRPKHRC
ncbi:MAG: hypothetical protein HXX10_19910 [Rhodoplanes sp.]|uniref:hypothetical protein n=1 Tax=Rhodoplanes sp. TaxID=1968906 RepID=UPI001841BA77|nr:hypothetical protein [Rhodoplanes sp.]NVO16301.1 hypothetical protein [Rhodoplanes sp.]